MSKIEVVEQRTGSTVFVVTLDSIGRQSPKSFATALFNHWRIGSAEKNNGVLVLIVKDARRVEVEVGRSLNSLVSNSWTTSMLQSHVLPKLKRGDYGKGVEEVVERVGRRISGTDYKPDYKGHLTQSQLQSARIRLGGEDVATVLLVGGLCTISAMDAYGEHRRERKMRTCDHCGTLALRVPWKEVEPATDMKAGRKERTFTCYSCGKSWTRSKTIPRYDAKRRRTDRHGRSTWEYYNYGSDSSGSDGGGGGSSDGGGGGGGDF